jgi:hypothetical protein
VTTTEQALRAHDEGQKDRHALEDAIIAQRASLEQLTVKVNTRKLEFAELVRQSSRQATAVQQQRRLLEKHIQQREIGHMATEDAAGRALQDMIRIGG